MIQKYTYTKEELKEGMTTELSIDFESYVDELAGWIANYVMNHYSGHYTKEVRLASQSKYVSSLTFDDRQNVKCVCEN